MGYKDFKVASFPRSGTHYLLALLNLNFWQGGNYCKYLYRSTGHKLHLEEEGDPDWAIFYIWRLFDGVAASVFAMRDDWCLDEDDYQRFLQRPLGEMYNPARAGCACLNGEPRRGVNSTFEDNPFILREAWKNHIATWTGKQLPNLFVVSYDRLLSNFDDEMLEIAEFLGSKKREFKNIKKRVGWWVSSKEVRTPRCERGDAGSSPVTYPNFF